MAEFDDKAKDWDTPAKKERAVQIAKGLEDHIELSKDMTAFEYGCGTGLLSFALKEKLGPMTLADVSEGMLTVLRKKIQNQGATDMEAVKLDLMSAPLPKARFDIVYTMMTLHHIGDTEQILTQFFNLLHPGGFIGIADLDEEDGSFHGKGVKNIHQGFNREKLETLLRKIGFVQPSTTTAYQLEHEINEAGETALFPIFLMTAQKPD